MPITPEEAASYRIPAENEAYDHIVKFVDDQLKLRYKGGCDKVKVVFDALPDFSQRVRDRLYEAYKDAGWGTVYVSWPEHYVELAKQAPPPCSSWD